MVPKLFNEAGIGNHTAWDESGTVVNRRGEREREREERHIPPALSCIETTDGQSRSRDKS